MHSVVSILFALVVVLGTVGRAAGQDYEVRLFRTVKVGDKFRLLVKGQHVESFGVFIDQRPVQQKADVLSVEMAGTVITLVVDVQGRPTKYSIEIEKWDATSVAPISPLLRPGVVVMAELQGQRYILKVNNVILDPMSSKVLSLVMPSHYSGVSDDDVFGTKERKKVGDAWAVNSETAARSLRDTVGMGVNPSDIIGTTTLDGVVKSGADDYLVISATLRIDKFTMPLPGGLQIQNAQLVGNFFGRFPTDLARLPLNESNKVGTQFSGSRPGNANTPEMTFKGVFERNVSREFQELN